MPKLVSDSEEVVAETHYFTAAYFTTGSSGWYGEDKTSMDK
jgi:hypothetical protein